MSAAAQEVKRAVGFAGLKEEPAAEAAPTPAPPAPAIPKKTGLFSRLSSRKSGGEDAEPGGVERSKGSSLKLAERSKSTTGLAVERSKGSIGSIKGVERSKGSYSSLLARGDDSKDEGLSAPKDIHEAAERGATGFIVRAIERSLDFDIDQLDRFGRTALHWAAELNRKEAAEALLDYGCNPAIAECNGRTAIHLAARGGHVEMLQTITEGLDPERKVELINQPDNFGITPVYLAMQKGKEGKAASQFLMDQGGKYSQ